MDKFFYNEASAAKLGWSPESFGCKYFDEDLIDAIKKFQKKYGLKADGLCGPSTYRRMILEKKSKNVNFNEIKIKDGKKNIICNNKEIPIDWDRVVLWNDSAGLKIGTGYRFNKDRSPTMFVNHWDVCLSSESCVKVLNNRGISVHFCIDNDGTIYQLLDTSHIAWHAGGKSWNNTSIGVEISNAYYPKYQEWYKKNGFGERPVWKNKKVHGKKQPDFLGFYDVQIEALKQLWKSISIAHDIPLMGPKVKDGVDPDSVNCKFSGFINHYNLTKNKIDCAGLDIDEIIKTI